MPKSDSYFLLELDDRLKKLHDRIVVVSSTLREEASDEETSDRDVTYGWIWGSIRHLTVGRQGRAVQHAKLWLLHWATSNGDEYIEVVVSSANLTGSAFKQQIQAAWRVCIQLQPQRSTTRLNSWGILPDFIQELAFASVGERLRLDNFIELLARADCPHGVTFIASVPGKHTRQELRRTPWGAAGLRKIIPAGRGVVSASVLSPFIGSWSEEGLLQWCAHFEGSPNLISLVWIGKDHPWAGDKPKWLLPKSSLDSLIESGTKLMHLRYEPNDSKRTDHFHDEHKVSDVRWSHAKVYAFRRGNSHRLLLTSANFSKAAWGDEGRNGELSIENFELGICIDQADWPFKGLSEMDANNAATSSDSLMRNSSLISWAQASWDGKKISVECKCGHDLTGRILFGDNKPLSITKWSKRADGLLFAQIPWVNAKRHPISVLLTCKAEILNVAVFDERKLKERESSFPTGIDEAVVEAIRDQLLFERYGGSVVSDDEPQSGNEDIPVDATDMLDGYVEDQAGQSDSYAVDTFVIARRHLQVVDNWAGQVNQAKSGSGELVLETLKRDGRLLMEAFIRKAKRNGEDSTGTRLAAEEMELRLKHFD